MLRSARSVMSDAEPVGNGYITGKVTAAESGEALGGIEARADSFYWVGRGAITWTAPDGTYKIGPLPDDDYRVRFWDPALLRRMEYYRIRPTAAAPRGHDKGAARRSPRHRRGDGPACCRAWPGGGRGHGRAGCRGEGGGQGLLQRRMSRSTRTRRVATSCPAWSEGEYALTVTDRSRAHLDGQSEKLAFPVGSILDMPDIRADAVGGVRRDGDGCADRGAGAGSVGAAVRAVYRRVVHHHRRLLRDHRAGRDVPHPGDVRLDGATGLLRSAGALPCPVVWRRQVAAGTRRLVTFKRGADLLWVDAALVRREDGPPVESTVALVSAHDCSALIRRFRSALVGADTI